MKKTFQAIRKGDIELVRSILEAKPQEIHAIAKQPPKKDDGQSLLQVALKTGHLDIADLLLDYQADVNFMESEDCVNEWRMPVLHDAIRCAIMNSRWVSKGYGIIRYEIHSTKQEADHAYAVLKRILEAGADIFAKDSYGNTTLERAILDARQILPTYNYTDKTIDDDYKITKSLRQDLYRIFNLLYAYGANHEWVDRISGKTLIEYYGQEPVAEFLNPDTSKPKKKSLWNALFRK